MTLEVVHRHEKLAPESGVEFMAPVSGAGFWSLCQRPYYVSLPRDRSYTAADVGLPNVAFVFQIAVGERVHGLTYISGRGTLTAVSIPNLWQNFGPNEQGRTCCRKYVICRQNRDFVYFRT